MGDTQHWTLTVGGMTCDHCAQTIDEAVNGIPGVLRSTTSYESGQASVVAELGVEATAVVAGIEARGYRVLSSWNGPEARENERTSGGTAVLDLLVVGGGSAGFAAAIRGAELGASVAIVEGATLGGTCVNVGCVPSKFLIRAAEVRHRGTSRAFDGVRASVEPTDLAALIEQKADLVGELRQQKYVDVLKAYPSVRLIQGRARFRADGKVEVDGEVVDARRVVVTTGASAAAPPIPGLAEVPYLTSTDALALRELPRRLIVIGGGPIALELAQLFARLGSEIVSCEVRSRLLSGEDLDVSTALTGYLEQEGVQVRLGARVMSVSGGPGDYRVTVEVNGEQVVEHGDQLLVATGRRPNTSGLGLEEAGIELDQGGAIVVDQHMRTTREGVYAAGDVVAGPAYVYVAAYEGNLAAENALNGNTLIRDLSVVPRVTFTDPTVASVGLTEDEAREAGIDVAVSKLPMTHVPRAIAAMDTRGFIKLVADRLSNQLVGAQILAPEAGDIIQLAVMAMRFGIRVDQIASTLHPYLTNAEGFKLAAQTFDKDVSKLSCCAA